MITYVLSANKLNIAQSCWELYNLNYNRRWKKNESGKPLEKGSLAHLMLAHFYREKMKGRLYQPDQFGIVLDEATNKARRDAVEMDLEVDEVDDSIRATRASLLYHQQDGMEVHAVEEPFSKTLYETQDREENGVQIHGIRLIYEGRVDLIATLPNNPIAIWDHKTESRRSTPPRLDNQFQGTSWVFGYETVIINKIGFQTSVEEKEKFRRVFIEYRDRELIEEWRTDAIKTALEAIERHRRAHHGKPDWPRNRTSCNKYSGCDFMQVCGAKPALRDVKLITWYHVRPEHELYEEDVTSTVTDLADL